MLFVKQSSDSESNESSESDDNEARSTLANLRKGEKERQAKSRKQVFKRKQQAEEEKGFTAQARRKMSLRQSAIARSCFEDIKPEQLTKSGLLLSRAILDEAQANEDLDRVLEELKKQEGSMALAVEVIKANLKVRSKTAHLRFARNRQEAKRKKEAEKRKSKK